MRVVFITMSDIRDVNSHGIYTDLMRQFREEGHDVYIVTPRERSYRQPTELYEIDGVHYYHYTITCNIPVSSVIADNYSYPNILFTLFDYIRILYKHPIISGDITN